MVRARMAEQLLSVTGPVITIGGDCGVELAAIEHALGTHPDLAVVWFDARPDLNTPATSPSHAFTGMVLRTLLGEGAELPLVPATPLAVDRVVLAGSRAYDAAEGVHCGESHRDRHGGRRPRGGARRGREGYGRIIRLRAYRRGCSRSRRLRGARRARAVRRERRCPRQDRQSPHRRFHTRGSGITEFAPASPTQKAVDDMPVILRLVGALARGTT